MRSETGTLTPNSINMQGGMHPHPPLSDSSASSRRILPGQSKFLNIIFKTFLLDPWNKFLELFGILKNLMLKGVTEPQFFKKRRIFFSVFMHKTIQLRSYETAAKHVYEGKWGHIERVKWILKTQLASWFLIYLFKRFRTLNAVNMGSVDQRPLKLLAVMSEV